jgi:hypothetical protein
MVYEFDDTIKKQIDFYYRNENNICDFTEYDENSYLNHRNNARIFRYAHEIISNDSIKDIIVGYIKKLRDSGNESYLSTSTLNHDEYEFHPLVNLHTHWYDYLMRPNITWDTNDGVPAFSIDRYDYKKQINFDKTMMDRYNTTSALKNKDSLEKCKNTLIERYGVDIPIKNSNIKNKMMNTIKEKYNTDCVLKYPEIQQKSKNTLKNNVKCCYIRK